MKLKNSKSAKKRTVKFCKNKIIFKKMSAQHRAKGKSKRTLKKAFVNFSIDKANIKKIKKLIPYR